MISLIIIIVHLSCSLSTSVINDTNYDDPGVVKYVAIFIHINRFRIDDINALCQLRLTVRQKLSIDQSQLLIDDSIILPPETRIISDRTIADVDRSLYRRSDRNAIISYTSRSLDISSTVNQSPFASYPFDVCSCVLHITNGTGPDSILISITLTSSFTASNSGRITNYRWEKPDAPVHIATVALDGSGFSQMMAGSEMINCSTIDDQDTDSSSSCIAVRISVRRSVTVHMFRLYLPSLLLAMCSWMAFWMHPESYASRSTVTGSCLISLLLLILINQRYESIGYKCLTASDIWQLAVFAFVFAAVIIAAIGSSSAQKECNQTKKRRNEHQQQQRSRDDDDVNRWMLRDDTPYYAQLIQERPLRTAKLVDLGARIAFPLLFLAFNIVYWIIYLPHYLR